MARLMVSPGIAWPLASDDRLAEARVAAEVAAAHARGDGELLDELREELAALGVDARPSCA